MHRKSNGRANGSKTLYTSHNAEPRMHGNIIARNNFENWRRQNAWVIKACQVALGPSFFSRDQLKVSVRTRNASCKVFLGKTVRHHLRLHYTTRKPFLEYYQFLALARILFKIWKISSFFSMSSCSSCLCSFIFTGSARICDVTMSHTWI